MSKAGRLDDWFMSVLVSDTALAAAGWRDTKGWHTRLALRQIDIQDVARVLGDLVGFAARESGQEVEFLMAVLDEAGAYLRKER